MRRCVAGGQAKHQFAAGDVGFNGLHRRLDDALDAHGGGQVIDKSQRPMSEAISSRWKMVSW